MEPFGEQPSQKTKVKYPQFEMLNEHQLHYKVMDFIRRYYPDALVIPGLGELQQTPFARCDAWKKGYQGGQPDILILNKHRYHTGYAIELKTPAGTGKVSDNQATFLENLQELGYLTLVSNDYDEVIMSIVDYFKDVRYKCPLCCKTFKTKETKVTHFMVIHPKECI